MVDQKADTKNRSTRRFWFVLNIAAFFTPFVCCGVSALWVRHDIQESTENNHSSTPAPWTTCSFALTDGVARVTLMRRSQDTIPFFPHSEFGLRLKIDRPDQPTTHIDLGYTEQSNTDFYRATAVLQNGRHVPILRVESYRATTRINMENMDQISLKDMATEIDTVYLGHFEGTEKFVSAQPSLVMESGPCGVEATPQ